jgi:malonyl CoA-acyl carrier protein transacylase
MGADLFDRFPDWRASADATLGYSIRELCVDDPRGELVLTQFTQPALFTVNAMMHRARLLDGKPAPAFVAGHSLGEYNALFAAGVFDFVTGLSLVARRGALMSAVRGGSMAAVIGLKPEAIEAVLAASDAGRRLDVANFNSFDQTVIAGPKADLDAVEAPLVAAGARGCIALNVSAPFHSRYMRAAQDEFTACLATVPFAAPTIPVVANATARPYAADAVRDTLARQIGSSVRWLESMLWLMDQIDHMDHMDQIDHPDAEFDEVGPGTVLTKLLAQIRKKRPTAS